MTEGGKDSRRLPNWIESFMRYSDVLPSPSIYRKWAALGIVSAVLEKKVWARTMGSNLYPNLYTVLVGPPGVGKSAVLSTSERMLRTVPDIFVAPSSLTTASLIDSLNLSVRPIINAFGALKFNSLQVVSSELGVFLPAYDPAFMNTLTKLYDGELYEERRRTGRVNHVRIENPQLSILGGTTPAYLNSFLPDAAWDQGFTSRTVFIYNGEVPPPDVIFSDGDDEIYNDTLYTDLIFDLCTISKMYGKVNWTQDAKDALTTWARSGMKPIPEHGKLTHYNSRRLAHCLKICIIMSAARADDLEVSLEDYQKALDMLLEAEAIMPDIFKAIGISGDARAIEDTWYAIYKLYGKTQKPVGEHIIVSFLKDRVPSHNISKIIETMIRSKMIKQVSMNGAPAYVPESKG